MNPAPAPAVNRWLFVLTILTGSFLLFLVQPMVARAALPRLGGAPAVWNSAMLVYQALLLGGYAYAHWLTRLPLRRQGWVHGGLLILAALTLPVGLADLPAPPPGNEVWWVPALFAASIGPVFFLVSAQAPLMQRWFAAHPGAGDPYALYAASNIGSFAGLIAYPLLVEPLLPLGVQSWAWSAGYALLIVLVVASYVSRRSSPAPTGEEAAASAEPVPRRTMALWLALAAVPSGLMLSTTTHLTTDVFAMPLLWVIPLGLYLLSFTVAFSPNRLLAWAITRPAPILLLLAGGMAASSRSSGSLSIAVANVALLFVLAVALHARLYSLRPPPTQLTLFYLIMSAGGALGGLFAALIAPLVFDWVWEHPLLMLAAGLLLWQLPILRWREMPGLSREMALVTTAALVLFAAFLGWLLYGLDPAEEHLLVLLLILAIGFIGVLVLGNRAAFVAVLAIMLLARGGVETLETSLSGKRTRSYFGIYTVRDVPSAQQRSLAHGTTLHGLQFADPTRRYLPTTYYGPTSGVGFALDRTDSNANVGIVGLGTGTLSCYAKPGQRWTIFEIDPAVVELSRRRVFTFVPDCLTEPTMRIGDARLELAKTAPGHFDLLAVDAFSSDAIPLHLLTKEAFAVYTRSLARDGLLLIHISNRYIDLLPVISAIAQKRGLAAALREDDPPRILAQTPSYWIALSPSPQRLAALTTADRRVPWEPLEPTSRAVWTDDYASILPHVRWDNVLRNPW